MEELYLFEMRHRNSVNGTLILRHSVSLRRFPAGWFCTRIFPVSVVAAGPCMMLSQR